MKTKSLLTAFLCAFIVFSTPHESKAIFALETTQLSNLANGVVNTAETVWHAITDSSGWIMDRLEQLDQLVELIENNVLTKAIRGFNELMTAIQTDISDVLGTVETLASAPTEILDSIMSIPSSFFDLFDSVLSDFKGIYNTALGTFDSISRITALGEDITNFDFSQYGNAYGFANTVSGLRTGIATKWLQGSEDREKEYKKWEKKNYGDDQSQLLSTSLDYLGRVAETQDMANEMSAIASVQNTADRVRNAKVLAVKAAEKEFKTVLGITTDVCVY